MPLLDLDLVKRHLRIFHDDEDTEIGIYRDAAETIAVEYLDREVVTAGETPVADDGIEITPAITAAILLLTGDMYEMREPDQKQEGAILPRAVRALLAPYRVWRVMEAT